MQGFVLLTLPQTMWCFIVKQRAMTVEQYRDLQKLATQTEVELFNEPYENLCLFDVDRSQYTAFVDYADLNGVDYNAYPERPTRDELLVEMRLG